jgi:hypothetical protein
MDNITALNVQYFSDPNSTTNIGAANAETASTINVTINGGKTTAGNSFTSSASLRASKLNSINTDASPITNPVVTDTQPRPDQVTFSWAGIPSATNYLISYNTNGGSWTNTTVSSSTTSYTVSANRGDTVSIKVVATNGAYTSGYGTDASTLPLWTNISLQNSWAYYGTPYNTAQFTKTSSCRVFLKGLIKSGTATSGTVIGNLPAGFRPLSRLVFQVATSSNTAGRIDVAANGDIAIMAGSNAWISLDTVSFVPTSCNYTWNELPFYNSWTNWGPDATYGSYENVHALMDNLGRVNMQGLAKAGTTTANTNINKLGDVSSTYTPPASLIIPAGGSGWSEFQVVGSTTGEVQKVGAQTSAYMGLQALLYPGATGSWSSPSFQNSWVNYGGGWPTLQYTKASDGVVTIRGLVKSGTIGAVIATLPAGYLPPGQELLAVSSSDLFGRIDIGTNGNIVSQAGSNNWVELNFSYIAN